MYLATGGANGPALGSDEKEIVMLEYTVIDVLTNEVSDHSLFAFISFYIYCYLFISVIFDSCNMFLQQMHVSTNLLTNSPYFAQKYVQIDLNEMKLVPYLVWCIPKNHLIKCDHLQTKRPINDLIHIFCRNCGKWNTSPHLYFLLYSFFIRLFIYLSCVFLVSHFLLNHYKFEHFNIILKMRIINYYYLFIIHSTICFLLFCFFLLENWGWSN